MDGLRKPDIIAIKDDKAIIIDSQVIGEQGDLNREHRQKIDYYFKYEEDIKTYTNTTEVSFSSATLSWRGVWSERSAKHLHGMRLVTSDDLKVIASRVLIGGINNYRKYMALTSVSRWVPRGARLEMG